MLNTVHIYIKQHLNSYKPIPSQKVINKINTLFRQAHTYHKDITN